MKDVPIHDMFIGGQWVQSVSSETMDVENPADGAIFARVPAGNAEDVDRAVTAGEAAQQTWGKMSGAERGAILDKAGKILRERLPEFVDMEVRQIGRPYREMAAQLSRAPDWFEYFGALARTHESNVVPFGHGYLNYTRRVPKGVVGALTPWNHPILILMKKTAPALAAGNSQVVKPSTPAPITPIMLGRVLQDAGLPDGAYNVVSGPGSRTGDALLRHPGVRQIDLTGGTENGRHVAAVAGERLIEVGAELGGKAAVTVFDDVDMENTVNGAVFAGFIAAGQTCVQGARVLVQDTIYDEFVERYVDKVKTIRLGDPLDASTQMGPLINKEQRETVLNYVQIAKDEGATVACGGKVPDDPALANGYYVEPTVLLDVEPDMRIACEEVFGPVVVMMPFKDEAEAIAINNGTPYGLGASVWTKNISRAHRVAHSFENGIVWINDHHRIDPASFWGGIKDSGLGGENGHHAYERYTELQSIIVKLTDDPFDWYASDEIIRYS